MTIQEVRDFCDRVIANINEYHLDSISDNSSHLVIGYLEEVFEETIDESEFDEE